MTSLNDATWAHTLEIHDAGLAEGTRQNYARAYAQFNEWAASERITEHERHLPISEPVICAYAASFAGHKSASVARSAMAGLRFAHERAGLHWPSSPRLTRILEAVSRLAPDEASRNPRPPVTLAMIDEALEALDPQRPFDQCVAAAMLTAFWDQLRLGEILSTTRRYDFSKLPARKHLRLRADAGGRASQTVTALWLPSTKTARRGEVVHITKHHNDPSYALQEHIADNLVKDDDPLFSYIGSAGSRVPLTKNAFLGRLNEIWMAAGMQRVSGHCFRIGGTTALLRLGIDTEIVKVAGRWKSDAFLRYWRTVDNIIATHTDLCDVAWLGDT